MGTLFVYLPKRYHTPILRHGKVRRGSQPAPRSPASLLISIKDIYGNRQGKHVMSKDKEVYYGQGNGVANIIGTWSRICQKSYAEEQLSL